MSNSLRFIPLGGLCEIGMNCAALAYGSTTIAIDCGVGFTDEAGAELVHADFGWLLDPGNGLRAVVITHGHEDHIGALPYLLKRVRVPVYAPPYAAALIRDRLTAHRLQSVDLRVGDAHSRFTVGPFEIERFGVHHSIADATGLIVKTPVGTIVHTGDFKIETDPCEGQRFDRTRLEHAAKAGVRLLLSDSTGASSEGTARLERDAETALAAQVARSAQRVVLATFSSNSFRLRAAFRIARARGRKVCLLGMSVRKHTEAALSLELLPPLDALIVSAEEASTLPRDRVMIVAAGTQGERGSSLSRLAQDEHPHLRLEQGDRVILSSRVIPGNELAVFDVINALERRGVEVVTDRNHPEIHASGHGRRDEQRAMIHIVRPEAFVPVHGTHHHLRRHAALAREAGVEQVAILKNGDVLEISQDGLETVGAVPTGRVYIEDSEPLGPGVMEDRRAMGQGGIVTIWFGVRDGRLQGVPRVVARGVVGAGRRTSLQRELAEHIRGKLRKRRSPNPEDAETDAREEARRFLAQSYRRRPLVHAAVDVMR